jgi:hypothetical protein
MAVAPLFGTPHDSDSDRMQEWQILPESGKIQVVVKELIRCPAWVDCESDDTELRAILFT